MKKIFILPIFLFTCFFIQKTTVLAQPDAKIEKKLSKLFAADKLEKCQKKARKFNKKYPKSNLPEYYLSKINIELFAKESSIQTSWKHLKHASIYSQKLPETYIEWKDSVQETISEYIHEKHDSTKILRRVKSVLQFYTKSYNDTLSIYGFYYPEYIKLNNLSTPNIVPDTDSLRRVLLIYAKELVGIPYKYAGEIPSTGFDCSGFTKYVYGKIGIELPHNAQLQSLFDGENISIDNAQPGDLIFFGNEYENSHHTSHAGIYFSDDNGELKVIHCVSGGVSIDGNNTSWDLYWKEKVLYVKRLTIFSE